MTLAVVALGTEAAVKVDRMSVPIENLKVHPLEATSDREPGDVTDHQLADSLPPISVGQENVLEIVSGLAAKARKMGIKNGISDKLSIVDSHDAFHKTGITENSVVELFGRDRAVFREIFKLGKFAH